MTTRDSDASSLDIANDVKKEPMSPNEDNTFYQDLFGSGEEMKPSFNALSPEVMKESSNDEESLHSIHALPESTDEDGTLERSLSILCGHENSFLIKESPDYIKDEACGPDKASLSNERDMDGFSTIENKPNFSPHLTSTFHSAENELDHSEERQSSSFEALETKCETESHDLAISALEEQDEHDESVFPTHGNNTTSEWADDLKEELTVSNPQPRSAVVQLSNTVEQDSVHTGQCQDRSLPHLTRSKKFRTVQKESQEDKISPDPFFFCFFCQKSFKDSTARNLHQLIHVDKQASSSSASDDSAVLATFSGERPFSCRYCPKAFKARRTRNRHERKHFSEKPFPCRACNKSFTEMSMRDTHERIHGAMKPYTCVYCFKHFSQLSNKYRHEQMHRLK